MPKSFAEPENILKIMAALSYLTGGIVGLIYVIVNGKGNQNYFFRFHFFQAILLGIFAMLLSGAAGSLGSIFSGIATAIASMTGGGLGIANIVTTGVIWVLQIAQVIFALGAIVGVVQSLRGKYVDIPLIGRIARQNLR